MSFDSSVTYTGPQAEFATLTGSPLWGVSVQDVVAAVSHGWTHQSGGRVPTPYGLGPLLHHFTTAAGRSILLPARFTTSISIPFRRSHSMSSLACWKVWRCRTTATVNVAPAFTKRQRSSAPP